MVEIVTAKHLRAVQKLSFCYLCGIEFSESCDIDRDHVPPKTVFASKDRKNVLWLPTHRHCNGSHNLRDEKIGQLIGLKRGAIPSDPRNKRLHFEIFPETLRGAVTNINIDEIIWRWISGFHAALYEEPISIGRAKSLATPLPKAKKTKRGIQSQFYQKQHRHFVEVIKINRYKNNLDKIVCYNSQVIYECVWSKADTGQWMCIFALNVSDWRELGENCGMPARGCAGFYLRPSGGYPENARTQMTTPILIPNIDPDDPFGP